MTTASTPICVVGAGTMGRGIAQTALAAGHSVTIVDPQEHQLVAAAADIEARLTKRHPALAADLESALTTCTSIPLSPRHPNTVVIEAVLESLDVKSAVFTAAADHFGPQCILATNTSSLSVSAIAARCPLPTRVVGMHFFNPVPVMKLVEVVTGLQTDPQVAEEIDTLAVAWGKTVARVTNAPGFIVNRVARGFYGEPLRLLQECVASPATLDAVIRGSGQFRMGPFELMDLIGNDVNAAVTRTVWSAFNFDPRFEPSRIQDELVAAGRYGRKSGHGFYSYATEHTPAEAPAQVQLGALAPHAVRRGDSAELDAVLERSSIAVTRDEQAPDAQAELVLDGTVVVITRGRTARSESAARGGTPVVVLDRCISVAEATAIAVASSHVESLSAVAAMLHRAGITAHPVSDVPGLVLARTLAVIANEAWEATMHGVASPADIDIAMKLGTNYPAGPFEWTRDWSRAAVLELLDALWFSYHDTRYRANRLLRD
ncbi:3-hydroxyacyl-CoA dehydrogenase [Rhodococcus sp. 15-725-2-2b]|uniref:3-hydroxyacyl-CoA dehydrogenase NAD-binding domain-containing protein n=1 Tax=Nocardiaceae TaxID=85025 RepID=UPI00056402C1|nr:MULTISPECIES: 3-hydroxyacyl-CoA dehydrogenase NAD-binding domain-containing protein [Rhodococcus]OZC61953.1 3-hydroxyacyl-CoA dehydrogenase [Rhodococcus sp. 06-470-2]OZC64549.1 3-hydroxyacyl-CoA dehydrogenase [Rhodococcus sp. 06-469-3-2]OZD51183.1 3-hydroxyacyl-CoA dehydrogenase [Rhodococcus sp. 06-1477-1A]OZE32121.1 3-hydroxyacyl-CoA dehydrogenase [Rhodococcus sp. 05-2254-5]OZE58082.1 3-hydroxyacyl-CoA dehydrogenase [Rhodococcus sp. 05-2221-1B]